MDVTIYRPDPSPAAKQVLDKLSEGCDRPAEWLMITAGGVEYSVILSRENIGGRGPEDWRWHISIAGSDDVPEWAHIAAIAHEVRPGVPLALGLPPKSWWINVHPHTLHLHELKDPNLIEQWRFERRGDTPT